MDSPETTGISPKFAFFLRDFSAIGRNMVGQYLLISWIGDDVAARYLMRWAVVLAAFAIGFVSSQAAATLLVYDPFLTGSNPAAGEYTAFTPPVSAENPFVPITGQNPTVGPTPFLTGPWVTIAGDNAPNAAVQETGLSFIGAPTLGGSQVSTPDAVVRRYLSTPLTASTEGDYYISFLANFGRGDYSDGVDNNDMGYRAVALYTDTDDFLLSVAYNAYNGNGGASQQNPLTAKMYLDGFGYQILDGAPDSFVEDGSTHLIVLRLSLSATDASDSVLVFLDPKSSEEPVVPNAALSGINVTLGAIGGFTEYGGSGQGPVFDELRVADTFIDALPDFPLPGDTNNDDLVDLVDFQNIVSHMNLGGATVPSTLELHPDVNGDGKVTIADYRLWKDHRTDLSAGAGGGGEGVVPEPASATMLVCGMLLAMSVRRGRRAREALVT
jgi:hypothetical protein